MYKLTAGFFFFYWDKKQQRWTSRPNAVYTSPKSEYAVHITGQCYQEFELFFSETNSIDSHVQFAKFWKGAGRGCVTWETYLTNTPFFDKSLTLALKDHMPLEWPKNVGQRFWISPDGEKWGICVKFKSPQAKKKNVPCNSKTKTLVIPNMIENNFRPIDVTVILNMFIMY